MGNITNAEYATWVNRMNALRTKHGLATTGLVAPGQNVKITADKMNNLLTNMTMASKWLNDSITNRATQNAVIVSSLQTAINNELTAWEAVCVHNTIFSANFTTHKSAFFASHKSFNSSDWSSDYSSNYTDNSDNSDDWNTFEGSSFSVVFNWSECNNDSSDDSY